MKVIFNIEPIKFPLTGIGRYTYELAKGLQEEVAGTNGLDELKLLAGHKFRDSLPVAQSQSSSFKQRLKKIVQKNYFLSESYRLIAPRLKAFALRKHSDFIYHSPNFYLPPFSGRSISTFHDLSVFTWPQCHPKERVRFMQKELLLTIKRADRLITDSEYTRQELADYFNYPLEQITAVPLASSADFYQRSEADVSAILLKYGLNFKQFNLFTGSVEPRKNLITLINAYHGLPLSQRIAFPLVISGYKGWESDEIHLKIQQGESEGWLRYLGFVPAEELPILFSAARLFVFPSLYEGFGLPVLEAMSSGLPVICSNSSSLPEVVGQAALMFDALDVDKLTELLRKGLEDESWYQQAKQAGLARAKLFSWQRCAKETIDVYKQV